MTLWTPCHDLVPTMSTASDFIPAGAGLERLRAAALECTGCPLHEGTTQTVFSKGSAGARLVFVGEQPGDMEDRRGEPFVGPAGQLLDRAVDASGLDSAAIYTTNAVKHFKFRSTDTGKRRIHATPDADDVAACRPWLLAEFAILSPDVVVALGATAAKALFGPGFRVTRSRGVLMPWPSCAERPQDFGQDGDDGARGSAFAMATLHPSAVLRADDQEAAFKGLVSDLVVARAAFIKL
jgi:uracil-DNA glycosylase family protein